MGRPRLPASSVTSDGQPVGNATGFRPLDYVTTVQMSLDAQAVLVDLRLKDFHLVGDLVLLFGGLAIGVAGYPFGFLLAIFGVLLLLFSQVDFVRRWQVNRYHGSLMGRRVTVVADEAGLHYASELATSNVPWSTLTAVRSNEDTVVFLRERALFGYVPASAFESSDEQLEFVRFARAHIGGDHRHILES